MKRTTAFIWICIMLSNFVFSQEQEIDNQKLPPLGIIFNIGNILEGVDSYQGGFGVKYINDNRHWRFLVDLIYDHEANLFSTALGATREYHFMTGPISPYYGWSIGTGYTYLYSEAYEQTEMTFPLNVAAVFGIELYLNSFISVFAEYALGAEYVYRNTTSKIFPNYTQTDFIINTGLGNAQKIGLTIYFTKKNEQPAEKIE